MTETIQWCTTHNSVAVLPDDGDHIYICSESNRQGDRTLCVIVDAEITWPSQ